MMNSVLIKEKFELGYGQIPIPKPVGDQLLIKVHSSPVNPSDIYFMRGIWGIPLTHPFTPGWEGSGELIEVGEDACDYAKSLVGKRVAFMIGTNKSYPWTVGGSMAEYAVTEIKSVVPLIDEIDFEAGASSFVNPMTGLSMVGRLKELKTKSVIITAAASQLGRMLVNICKNEEITTICTVRKQEQVELVKGDHVVNTSDADWKKQMAKICGELKPTGCLECISGSMVGDMMNCLAPGGTLILYGTLSEEKPVIDNSMITKGHRIEGFLLNQALAKMDLEEFKKFS